MSEALLTVDKLCVDYVTEKGFVRAVDEVVTLRLDRDLFFQLITEFPQIGVELLREMAQRLERTTRKLGAAMAHMPSPGNSED